MNLISVILASFAGTKIGEALSEAAERPIDFIGAICSPFTQFLCVIVILWLGFYLMSMQGYPAKKKAQNVTIVVMALTTLFLCLSGFLRLQTKRYVKDIQPETAIEKDSNAHESSLTDLSDDMSSIPTEVLKGWKRLIEAEFNYDLSDASRDVLKAYVGINMELSKRARGEEHDEKSQSEEVNEK